MPAQKSQYTVRSDEQFPQWLPVPNHTHPTDPWCHFHSHWRWSSLFWRGLIVCHLKPMNRCIHLLCSHLISSVLYNMSHPRNVVVPSLQQHFPDLLNWGCWKTRAQSAPQEFVHPQNLSDLIVMGCEEVVVVVTSLLHPLHLSQPVNQISPEMAIRCLGLAMEHPDSSRFTENIR